MIVLQVLTLNLSTSQLKLQQEQERLELEKKKREEELAAEALRRQKLEQDRQIKEQERLKREEEKRQKEEGRLRKEEERKKRRLKEERAKAAEREKKRKEEEELKKKRAEERLNQERKRKLHNTKISQEEEEREEIASNTHQILSDSSATADIIPNRRRISVAGPIGSPIKSRSISTHIASNDSENHHSFFSNFLFGPIKHTNTTNRRFSTGGDNINNNLKWTNGWTPLTALSDNVHGKLFGDVIFKNSLILERARLSYTKLDEIAQIKYFVKPNYQTLIQLHQMLNEIYHHDHVLIDIRELYEAINQPSSGFQCIQHQQHGYIVRMDSLPISPQLSSSNNNI